MSPLQLLSPVDDQVAYLRRKEVTAASISSSTEKKATLIEKGKVSAVFDYPEVWIKIERRRAMLRNSVYSNKLYALAIDEAHVIIIRLAHKSSSEDFFGSTKDFVDNNKKYNRQDRN